MRSRFVVVTGQGPDQSADVVNGAECGFILEFFPHAAIEALREAVLHRLPGTM